MTETPRERVAHYDDATRRLKIVIPVAPISLNTMLSVYKGRKLLTKSGRRWRDAVDPLLSSVNVSYAERVSVWIEVWPKTARAYDIDNCAKPILDALQRNGILSNDDIVYSLHLNKHDKNPGYAGGEIWVDVYPFREYVTDMKPNTC